MCDFSLQSIRSRPAKVGDTLTTYDFGTGTRGFAAVDDPELAVCVCCQERSWPSPGKLRARRPAYSGGRRRQSTTRRQSFDKSTRTSWPHITMRSNFRMGGPCC
jgi:hypothetical protein